MTMIRRGERFIPSIEEEPQDKQVLAGLSGYEIDQPGRFRVHAGGVTETLYEGAAVIPSYPNAQPIPTINNNVALAGLHKRITQTKLEQTDDKVESTKTQDFPSGQSSTVNGLTDDKTVMQFKAADTGKPVNHHPTINPVRKANPFASKLARYLMAGSLAVTPVVSSGCLNSTPEVKVQPVTKELLSSNKLGQCLEDTTDDCMLPLETNTLNERVNNIQDQLVDCGLSTESDFAIKGTLHAVYTLERDPKVSWHKFYAELPFGVVSFNTINGYGIKVVVPPDITGREADVDNATVHELRHAVEIYNALKSVGRFDKIDAEYTPSYLGDLTEYCARPDGFSLQNRANELATFGLDSPEVVALLDRQHIGPKQEIYHFLYDWQIKYQLGLLKDVLEKSTVADDQHKVDEIRTQIAATEDKYRSFPTLGTEDEQIFNQLKARTDLFAPDFFSGRLQSKSDVKSLNAKYNSKGYPQRKNSF